MEPPNFSDPFKKLEKTMEKLTRKLENSVNWHTGTSMRRPPNPNKLEAQKADAVSYISKPNATCLPTPKTSKSDQQAAETAKIFADLKATAAAAIHQDNAEQKARHEAKKAKIFAQQAAEEREVMSKFNALKAELTLAEKQLAKAEAEAKEEPPRRRKRGKVSSCRCVGQSTARSREGLQASKS